MTLKRKLTIEFTNFGAILLPVQPVVLMWLSEIHFKDGKWVLFNIKSVQKIKEVQKIPEKPIENSIAAWMSFTVTKPPSVWDCPLLDMKPIERSAQRSKC
jgi:hypothetical protein